MLQYTNSTIVLYYRDKRNRHLSVLLHEHSDYSPIDMVSLQSTYSYIKSNDIDMMHLLSHFVPLEKMIIGMGQLIILLCRKGDLVIEFTNRFGIQHLKLNDIDCFQVNVSILILAYLFGKPELIDCVRSTIEKKYSIRHLKLFSIVPGTSPSSNDILRFTIKDLEKK